MASAQAPSSSLADLSIEELANLEITSASRRSENLSETPAAAYVISREDILRSGVTSIPEALRLAPGVEVARNNAHDWSISIRGFNSDLANKLLVLIDGRSVYSPLYAGVFWDVQDLLLEDVERIEVIAGPGGTAWGANAVNGVINIITRSAKETQGVFTEVGGGNEEQGFGGFRYGRDIGNDAAARVYVKYFNRDSSRLAETGEDGVDDWNMLRGGFRLDWNPNRSDSVTLQGDAYGGEENGQFQDSFTLGTLPDGTFEDDSELSGANLLGRWTRVLDSGSNLRLQVYYDYSNRNIPNIYNEARNTLDIDFQHQFRLAGRHGIIWGAGFRLTSDEIDNSAFAAFEPDSRTDETLSFFLQDKIDLWSERLFLTLGSKFEHNDYTGFEYQPSARLSWLLTGRQTLWAAVSRAVRIPSRLDSDLRVAVPVDIGVPAYFTINGTEGFDSEELIAYEAGYRVQASGNLSFDLAAFYNEYDKLQTAEPEEPEVITDPPLTYIIAPNFIKNRMEGESYGSTVAVNWEPISEWRLKFQYTYFDLHLHKKAGSLEGTPEEDEGYSPENQFSVHSFLDLPYNLSFYTGMRYVDNLPNQDIDDYIALDVSLGWRIFESMEISVTGQNLTDKSHPEFGSTNEMDRSVYGKVTWHF